MPALSEAPICRPCGREDGSPAEAILSQSVNDAYSRMPVRFGRAIAAELDMAGQRQWLVTDGFVGHGSGTVASSPFTSPAYIA